MKKLLVLILSFSLIIFLYFRYQSYIYNKTINDSYSDIVIIKNDSYIYNENLDAIYKVYKNITIELDDEKRLEKKYFKIKGYNYYVKYSDIEKIETLANYDIYNNLYRYHPASYNIKTNIDTQFFIDNKKIFSNYSNTFVSYMNDDDYYYIDLNNRIYQVKKEEVELEENNDKKDLLSNISVIYFDELDNDDDKLKYIKDNNYLTISEYDLELFLNKRIELPLKSVLLIYNDKLDISKINKYNLDLYKSSDIGMEFISGDSQINRESKKYYWYKVNKKTSLNRFIDMLNGKKEVKKTTSANYNNSVAVLNYHFFYSSDNNESCEESICLDIKNFEQQLKYLKDNNIKTLTMQEYVDWIYGKKTLSQKSVLITIDDGAMGTDTHLPEMLNKYDAKATLFLISGWWPISKYKVGNLEIQSHTHDLHHNNFKLNDKTGYKTLMLSYDEIINDLKLSIDTIGDNLAFCYPFYKYNDNLVNAVKNSGFKVAFVGGNSKSTRNSNKFKIPRYIIYKNTSLSSFINMIK